MSRNAMYKAFRKKDIKVGDKWITPETTLKAFDSLKVYLADSVLFGAANTAVDATGGFTVVYEDRRLLIVNKPQGLPVHPDRNGSGVTLIELVHEYLGVASVVGSGGDHFVPAMCHRIDRNTGGLVAIAKDREALDVLLGLFSSGGIKKEYGCIAHGALAPPTATLRAYMTKDSARGIVKVYPTSEDSPLYAREIITRYKTISYDSQGDTSKLEVTLLTGRTHQIRAHLASIGHPIIGDGKYCPGSINRHYRAPYQMLFAIRLKFPAMQGFDVSSKLVEISDPLVHPRIYR